MRISPTAFLVVLLLAACGEEDRTPVVFSPSVEKNATASDDTTPRLASVTQARLRPPRSIPAAGHLTGRFDATGAAGGARPSGTAQLSGAGTLARVDVALSGVLSRQHYDGALRSGTCSGVGHFLAGLNTVSSDAEGAGRASTFAEVPLDSLAAAPHVLVYGRAGRVELCAEIGRAQANPSPDGSDVGDTDRNPDE